MGGGVFTLGHCFVKFHELSIPPIRIKQPMVEFFQQPPVNTLLVKEP